MSQPDPHAQVRVTLPPSPLLPEQQPVLDHHDGSSLSSPTVKSVAGRKRMPGLGLLLVAVSALMFSLMSLCVKVAGRTVPSLQLVFFRGLVNWLLNAAAIVLTRTPWRGYKADRPWLMARALTGVAGMCCVYLALTAISMSDATVLAFTSPVWCGMLAIYILGEQWHLVDAVCAVLALAGVVLVSRPTFMFGASAAAATTTPTATPVAHWVGVTAALVGSLMSALTYISVRKISTRVPTLIIVHYVSATAIVLPGILMFALQSPVLPPLGDVWLWLTLLGLGTAGFLGQVTLNRGLKLEKAGPASAMRFLDIVFVFVWDTTLLGQTVSWWSVGGAVLVTTCTIIIAVKKWLRSTRARTHASLTEPLLPSRVPVAGGQGEPSHVSHPARSRHWSAMTPPSPPRSPGTRAPVVVGEDVETGLWTEVSPAGSADGEAAAEWRPGLPSQSASRATYESRASDTVHCASDSALLARLRVVDEGGAGGAASAAGAADAAGVGGTVNAADVADAAGAAGAADADRKVDVDDADDEADDADDADDADGADYAADAPHANASSAVHAAATTKSSSQANAAPTNEDGAAGGEAARRASGASAGNARKKRRRRRAKARAAAHRAGEEDQEESRVEEEGDSPRAH